MAQRPPVTRYRRVLRQLQVAIALLCVAGPVATQGLDAGDAEARAKLLKEQAVAALTSKDPQRLFLVMDEYRSLESSGVQVPAGLFFAEADAARSGGDPVRAERAFNDFFRVSSPEGAAFNEAMRAYGEFRTTLADTTWPIVEGMVAIAGTTTAAAAAGTSTEVAAPGEPRPRIAPFSLARRPVTRAQFAEFVAASGYQLAPAGDDVASGCRSADAATDAATAAAGPAELPADAPAVETAPTETPSVETAPTGTPVVEAAPTETPTAGAAPTGTPAAAAVANEPVTCIGWTDAIAYVDWLRKSTGVRFRLPSATEWQYAARTPPIDGPAVSAPAWEWVADCAVTSGVGVTPESTVEANRAACIQRVALTDGTTAEGAQAPSKTRRSHPPQYRAPDVGFRLAL